MLTWSGPLSIENALACQTELRAALDAAGAVAVDLRGSTSIDLAILQLLCAAQLYARNRDKQIHLHGSDCVAVTTALAANGFSRTTPCCAECGSFCLWSTAAVVA